MIDGLKDKHREAIIGLLSKHEGVERVVLFGSRAMETHTPTSDVDIMLYGKSITLRDQSYLAEKIEGLNMPQSVDIVLFSEVKNEKLKGHIEREGVVWFERVAGEGGCSDWREISLDKALDINPAVKMQKGDIYPFVDMQSIEAGNKYVVASQEREFKSSGSRFLAGDTLMARITPCLENGKICRYRSVDDKPAHGSTEFIVLRHREGITHPELVYYLTISDQVKPYAIAQMTGSSGRQRVPVNSFKHLTINLPSLAKQKAIADILSSLDDKIELNRRMCETLEKIAATLFKSWFVDFDPVRAKSEGRVPEGMAPDLLDLFPDSFEDSDLGMIPKGWKIDEIGELVDSVGGATPSTKSPEFWDGEHYWATPKDLSSLTHRVLLKTERKITNEGVAKISSGLLLKGTVLISSRAPIGYVAVAEVPVAINQGFIAMKCTKKLGTQFALQWTLANLNKIKSYANGSTFQEISKKAFRPIKVVYPKNGLLDEFEAIASSLHKRCVEMVEQNNQLTEMRDNLLPKLISGELRVENKESS